MPFDASRYPADWPLISRLIRVRAEYRCECVGECGRSHAGRCCEKNGEAGVNQRGRVVLTVAHLGAPRADGTPGDPRDKMDVRDENLKAMCQACHLRYDAKEHAETRRATLAAKLEKLNPSFL